jgi:hypothetical protein
MCEHRWLTYSTGEEFAAAAAPFLAHASEHSEAALAVTSKRNLSLLRRAVGRAGDGVRFADSSAWYTSPLAALNAYEEFCATRLGQGAAWVRIIAELDWSDRDPPAARSWIRFEALLDVVLAHLPVSILCVYDSASLRPTVERHLSAIHAAGAALGAATRASSHPDARAFLL